MSTPFNTARAYIAAGNLDAARKIARDAMEKAHDDVTVHDLMVDIEFAAKAYEKALKICREALARWPDHAGLRLSHALALMYTGRGGDAKKAVEKFEEDFSFRPLDATLLHTIWQAQYGSLKRAKYYRRRFEELAPDSPHIAMLDAMIAGKADDMLGRERASRRMTEDAPMDADAHARLAYAQFDLFRLSAARRSTRAALTAEPTKRRVEAVLWLSWMVLFPPFFFAHLYHFLDSMRVSRLPRWLAVLVHIPFGIGYYLVLFARVYPAIFGSLYDSILVWIFLIATTLGWSALRNAMLIWFGRRSEKPKDVSLRGY